MIVSLKALAAAITTAPTRHPLSGRDFATIASILKIEFDIDTNTTDIGAAFDAGLLEADDSFYAHIEEGV